MMRSRYPTCIVLVMGILGLPLLGLAQEREPEAKKTPSVGEKAPDFTLEDFGGRRFTLSDRNDSRAVLLWFTNLCEGCRAKFQEVQKLKKEYGDSAVEVVAVSQLGTDRKTVEEAIRTHRLTLRFLYDPKGEVTTRYNGSYVPGACPLINLYLIDEKGTITYAAHYPGATEAEIRTQLTGARRPQHVQKSR